MRHILIVIFVTLASLVAASPASASDPGSGSSSSSGSGSVAADATPRTPEPVVVAECSFTVPESEYFTYQVTYQPSFGIDPEDEEPNSPDLEPGATLTVPEVTFPGLVSSVVAVAKDGVTVADDATTEWKLPAYEDCQPDLVTVTAECSDLTFTNVADEPVMVEVGSLDSEDPEASFELAAGATKQVTTKLSDPFFVAMTAADDDAMVPAFQFDTVEVERCAGDPEPGTGGAGSGTVDSGTGTGTGTGVGTGTLGGIPLVAPAAGILDEDRRRPVAPLLGASVLLALAAIAVRTAGRR